MISFVLDYIKRFFVTLSSIDRNVFESIINSHDNIHSFNYYYKNII